MAMNFWEHQERAQVASGRLLAIFFGALLSVVALMYAGFALVLMWVRAMDGSGVWNGAAWYELAWSAPLFFSTFGGVAAVVLYSWWRWVQANASGGSSVALSLGGRHISSRNDGAFEQRLYNVVAEISIASGIPAPQVFILDREPSLNAFAAGYSIEDAAVCVTRGTLEVFSRDELQAVIAHEFSHILNGDMATNLRLAGVLSGFTAVGGLGSDLIRLGTTSSEEGEAQTKGFAPFIVLGALLTVVGGAGQLVGQVIKSAFARQREYLADALAVQFTRNGNALASALRKIGGYEYGSGIRAQGATAVSHLMFSNIQGGFGGLLATHPPLALRIRQIDPNFVGTFPRVAAPAQIQQLQADAVSFSPRPVQVATVSELAGNTTLGTDGPSEPLPSGEIVAGSELLASIPPALLAAIDSPLGALATLYAILANRGCAVDRALEAVSSTADATILAETRRLLPEASALPPGTAVAIARLCAPQLRTFSRDQRVQVRAELQRMAEADRTLSAGEFLLIECIAHWLEPRRHDEPQQIFAAFGPLADDVANVLGAVADAGGTEASYALAWRAGVAALPSAQRTRIPMREAGTVQLRTLRSSVERLRHGSLHVRRLVVFASAAAVVSDGVVNAIEADLVGFLADLLGVAMPPITGNSTITEDNPS